MKPIRLSTNHAHADLYTGDALEVLGDLDDRSIQTVVTSPPYWGLRDYGIKGQIGMESTPEAYVQSLVWIFNRVKRVLRDDGTIWLNLGDSFSSGGRTTQVAPTLRTATRDSASGKHANLNGLCVRPGSPTNCKPKDLIGIPWMVAFALRSAGWYLRSDIIWQKPNPMPESVLDRPTRCHEYLFLLSKRPVYYYNADAIKEDAQPVKACGVNSHANRDRTDKQGDLGKRNYTGFNDRYHAKEALQFRNKRDVWTVAPAQYRKAHFATFPTDLIIPCILAGSRPLDVVLDLFSGSGTTGQAALRYHRHYVGIELNPKYTRLAKQRLQENCKITSVTKLETP